MIGASAYGYFHIPPKLPTQEIQALFSPASLQTHHSPFHKGLKYKGTLTHPSFQIPCSIYFRGSVNDRFTAGRSYVMAGTIEQRGFSDYLFKPKTWKPLSNTWSLAELRFQTKESFRNLLSQHITSPKTASFLSSLSTGDVEDRMLRYEFGRVGLQHILAISGFHFGILIAFFSFCLGLFLKRTSRIFFLFISVLAYYLFVGSSPAVERSFLTALFYLIGKFLNRSTSGLNLLGCAMGIELIFDPLAAGNLGFQLSFLSCLSILLFLPPFEKGVGYFLPKRSFPEIRSLSVIAKHGYLFSSFFRESLSLTLAVNCALLPLLLFHFHQFPFLSFIYNLFFPFFIGVALFLLLGSLLFQLLFPPVAALFFWLTNVLTNQLLDIAANPPLALDFSIRIADISISFVIAYLLLLALLRISTLEERKPLL